MITNKLTAVELNNIRIEDSFWNKYTRLVTKEIIPYQWRTLNDQVDDAEPSHCILNFEIAAGLKEGDFQGFVFQDTDLAKWLEAVAYSLAYEPNAELEEKADKMIELIGKAQEENGYLNTYFSINAPGKQFKNLKEGHELYTTGHMIEAAVAYYKVTGKDAFLNIMKKNADLICDVFHTDKYENAIPGHEEIELALVKLYEVTKEKKYLDMAMDFVNRRGTEPNYLYEESSHEDYIDVWHVNGEYLKDYGQSHLPVRMQNTAEGHAVRAVYLFSAMADLAHAYKDEELFAACETLYENITQKRMYITGGIGSSGILERFTVDYDLPNDSNYSESCASIGLAMFARRMAQITGDAKYIDTMERALINTVLSGVSMDGKRFFYVNPLEVWPDNCKANTSMEHVKPVRQKWFACACCPPNIARTLASLGEYAYFCDRTEGALYVNMFVGGNIDTSLSSEAVTIDVKTEFPWNGRTMIKVAPKNNSNAIGTMYIRIPEYADNYRILVNGKEIELVNIKGYARVEILLDEAKDIEVLFDMPALVMNANPMVRENVGKIAIVKGPIVYCLEEADNGKNLSGLYIDTKEPLKELFDAELLGGVMTILADGVFVKNSDWTDGKLYAPRPVSFEKTKLKFVPYCNWGNRKEGEMAVWVKSLR